jgi:predicted exporter
MIEILATAALLFLGLYAGSLLTEGAVLVPIWRGLPADDFFRMHKDVGPRLYKYFTPVTIAGVATPLAYVVFAQISGPPPTLPAYAAAGLCVAALGTYFLYFERANRSFAERSLANDALPAALAQWAAVHWIRTVMVVGAFALLLISRPS